METDRREDTTHEPASSTWPWIPDPANVPAPLLQRPLHIVSDWISSEKLCEFCSRLAVGGEKMSREDRRYTIARERKEENWDPDRDYVRFTHRTARDLDNVAGAAVRAGESCCPLCALIWKRMRDHFDDSSLGLGRQVDSGTQPGTNTYAKWAGWDDWQYRAARGADPKVRDMEFSRRIGQDDKFIELNMWPTHIDIVHGRVWPSNYKYRALTLYTLPDSPCAGKVDHHIPWRTLTQAAQYTASWARQCLQNHTMCPKSIESPLPKRLVDVGRYGSSETSRVWINPSAVSVRAGDTPLKPIMGSYVALSYCWGLETFEVVNPQNLASMTEEIPVKSLPLTIQDAIELTRLLGIRYLWVDSLCILQGSSDEAKADWKEESVKMRMIYHNALLTIGAAAGKSAHSGIRPTVDPPAMQFCALPKGFGGGYMSGQVYAGLQETALHEDAIHRRAWTFQELLLSARYVNLGDPKIQWHCKEVHWNSQRNRPTDSYPKMTWAFQDSNISEWQMIIYKYSSRSLSREEDRLIALSGVAKEYWLRGGQRDEYLAGLWKSTITQEIVWRVVSETSDLVWRRQKDPHSTLNPEIPSWSWASHVKAVSNIFDHEKCSLGCAQFIDSHVVGDPDQFGHLVQASIRMRGWIKKGLVRIGIGYGNGSLIDTKSTAREFGWVYLDNPIHTERQPVWISPGEQQFEVICLQIHEDENGLVLLPDSPKGNRYRRIGMFHTAGSEGQTFDGDSCEIVELV